MDVVTGGTGFVGAHVVRALLSQAMAREEKPAVRCLVREGSRTDNLKGLLGVEAVTGDLRAPETLDRAFAGCRRVFHCAADYRLWTRDPASLYETNVDGTLSVLTAAEKAGVEKVVYTSSVGALGLAPGGAPANESTPVALEDMVGHYKRSKFLAERAAERFAKERSYPVVIVNPSTPVGELDLKPTPTGQMIVDFLRGRTPAYVETGLNLVDVRDVAAGHLLAAEAGRLGEKYILGGENLSLKAIFDRLGELSGVRSPTVRLPHAVPWLVAALQTGVARVSGRPPKVSLESVRMAKKKMYFDSSKAKRELGYAPVSVDGALARAVAWFREQGYA